MEPGTRIAATLALAAIACGGPAVPAPSPRPARAPLLGFTGAGFLDKKNPANSLEFLAAMGYADEEAFYDDVVRRMRVLSAPLTRVEFHYLDGQGIVVPHDGFLRRAAAAGFEIVGMIDAIAAVQGGSPDAGFEPALAALVAAHPEIAAWQLGNEPDLTWRDPSRYPPFFLRAQPVVRATCPGCRVLLAGISNQYDSGSQNWLDYDAILAALAGAQLPTRPFDVFDFHYYPDARSGGAPTAEAIAAAVSAYRGLLDKHGLAARVSFFCTETGHYTGDPPDPALPPRTEEEQARDLARQVAWMASEGVERIFWWTLVESWGAPGIAEFFDQMGLIYNGLGEEALRGVAGGTAKRSAVTYRLLAEALAGTAGAVRLEAGVYRFAVDPGPVFVVWDEGGSGQVALTGLPWAAARVTDLVPDAQGRVATADVLVSGGALTLSAGADPRLVGPGP